MYLFVGAVQSATPVIKVKFMLDKIPNSIFSLDKSLLFNENLYINIFWNAINQIMFTAQSVTNPTIVDPTKPPISGNITELSLWLVVDHNFETQRMIQEKIAGGRLSILVLWVFQNIVSVPSASSQNLMLHVNDANGRVLKKIYYSPIVASSFYNHNNLSNTISYLSTFNTYLDSIQLQQGIIKTSKGYDYARAKDRLCGSCIENENEYYFNWCYCEDFTSGKLMYEDDMENNIIDGVKLTGVERIYQIISTFDYSTVSLNHTFYYVTQKQLDITNNTITFS